MPPISASALYSPLMNVSLSRTGLRGSRTLPNSKPAPSPLAHHSLEWKPLPENRQANRTGGSDALPFAVSSPQTGTDSSHGNATVTPRPRRKARRERGYWLTTFAIARPSRGRVGRVSQPVVRDRFTSLRTGWETWPTGRSLKLTAADHAELRAPHDLPDRGLHPAVGLVQLRRHLVDQRLVRQRDRPPESIPQQPAAEQANDDVLLLGQQEIPQAVEPLELGPVAEARPRIDR